ncbi:helix-turn-helix transcriptional regulator [Actinocorallia sp. A-T 12471]|uniref:helix-turn-helix domain-containing protein n=1 Tax=Actinocorallia sp. A-T 12471 TaxID=3089813 RepID=UPI0029CDB774|nr:helix-turn-helix transcriptional regulator [Actinocorallia sp. A-T 12471]MDX6739691.1 helix-turn-helix transcriptional regulator [Actinocorallia sp. A-T 12471]
MGDNQLGVFLRERRELLTPEAVGLPTGPRRRTPGLRRSELAMLAGVSVEYLTRLEQGRDRNPSSQILGALADALRLDRDERTYLRFAAKAVNGDPAPCAASDPPAREVRPALLAILRSLEPTPAVLLNRISDVLAHTVAYERYARPLGILDGAEPNLLTWIFTDPRARAALPDWDAHADAELSAVRMASSPDDTHLNALAEDLTVLAGAAFSDRFRPAPLSLPRPTVATVRHPEAGPLRLHMETLASEDHRVLIHLPADAPTEHSLNHLVGKGTLLPLPTHSRSA